MRQEIRLYLSRVTFLAKLMKLIEENQLIGLGGGVAVFRNLYEDKEGNRTSVPTSKPFWIEEERIQPSGKMRSRPSQKQMFQKWKLP